MADIMRRIQYAGPNTPREVEGDVVAWVASKDNPSCMDGYVEAQEATMPQARVYAEADGKASWNIPMTDGRDRKINCVSIDDAVDQASKKLLYLEASRRKEKSAQKTSAGYIQEWLNEDREFVMRDA